MGCLAVTGAGVNLCELVLQGTGLGVGLRDALLQLGVLFFDLSQLLPVHLLHLLQLLVEVVRLRRCGIES